MGESLFTYWKDCLEESIAALDAAINATPQNCDAIMQALDTMMIDHDGVLLFGKIKRLNFDYESVVPTLRKARNLQAKAKRLTENQVAKVVVQSQPELLVRLRKLPKLIVPIFIGKFADYPSFRKVFRLKHDDSGATGAERLVHLQNNVSGEPKLLIQNLSADDCNYKLAFAPKVDPPPPRETRKGDCSLSHKSNRKNRERKYKEHACVFCSEQHYSSECLSVITLSDRKAALKDKCVPCLSPKHTQPSCPHTYICRICNKKNDHTKALCLMAYKNNKPKKLMLLPVVAPATLMPPPTKQNTGIRTLNFAA